MLNFSTDRTDLKSLASNQSAIERHIDFDHYVRGFTPGEFVPLTATAILDAVSNDWPVISMADAATSHVAVSFRKPSEWRTGHLRARYWYTSPVGSTNPFRILLSVRAIRDGEVLPSTALLFAAANAAGPAVAYTVIRSAHAYTATALGSDDELFALRLVRLGADGADTNVNDFLLLYVEIEHIPAVQVSQ